MENKEFTDQKSSGLSKGFSAGLKIGLFFTLGFLLLGYPIEWSAGFGVIGCLAGSLVSAWWQSEEADEPADEIVYKTLVNRPKVRFQTRLKHRQQRAENRQRRWNFGRAAVGRLLGRKRS